MERNGLCRLHSNTNNPASMRKGSAVVRTCKLGLLCSISGFWTPLKEDFNREVRLSIRQEKDIRRVGFRVPKEYETTEIARLGKLL